MKFRKLIAAISSIAMLATMVATSVSAEITADKPTIELTYGDYEVFEDGGVTYYDITVTVTAKGWTGYAAHTSEGRPPKSTVTGLSSYGHEMAVTNGFYEYAATSDGIVTSSNARKVAWAASGFDKYLTADACIGTYTIETTNPDAGTTFSLVDFESKFTEITAGTQTDYVIYTEADFDLSIDIPSYNAMNAPEPPAPPADVDATVEIEAFEGADSAAGAYTFYYATTVTKGTADIEYVDVLVETGVRAQQAILSADLFSLLDGNFTFYVGNKSDNANTTYTATATVIAGNTVTDTASYTTPAE